MDTAALSPSPSPASGAEHARVLTLACTNRKGIVHAVTGALLGVEADITESQQYDSPDTGDFFMRVEFVTPATREDIEQALAPVREEFGMRMGLWDAAHRMRTLVMCSKDGHTLNDLLFQQRAGTLPIEIPVVVSNHLELQSLASFYGVPFIHVPVSADPETPARVLEDLARGVAAHAVRKHQQVWARVGRVLVVAADQAPVGHGHEI